ncbi:MAG: flagellar basal body rod protein FlgC [Proteobacteria bacterium]|nr:flagellar basal body rod protein FlgC [Pseudomonadota bacterium]
MQELFKAMFSASGGMRAQAVRLRLIGENVANADTPGYHRKTVSFETVLDRASGASTVKAGRVRLDRSPLRESYEPGHPLADARGIVSFSNVNTLIEIADAREANRSYQANLTIFDQARRMYGGVLGLLRR